ncbi:MAG: GspE/PulE family protein [Alphaproteobacteria bacterium]
MRDDMVTAMKNAALSAHPSAQIIELRSPRETARMEPSRETARMEPSRETARMESSREAAHLEDDAPPPFGEMLLAEGLITPDQLRIALHEQKQSGGLLGQVIRRLGYLDDGVLCRMLAARAGLAVCDVQALAPEPSLIGAVPHQLAARLQMLPLRHEHGVVAVACADPYDIVAQDQLRACLGAGVRLRLALAPAEALRAAIDRCYGVAARPTLRQAPESGEVAAWLSRLLAEAAELGASDIHLEPQPSALAVRLRIDGVLHQVKALHRDFWPPLLQRLKILSGVNIAETRMPQDGRFSENCGGASIDFRANFMPTVHGESAALRLLDPRFAALPLASLGFGDRHIAMLRRWMQRPEGLVLVTGPTGSGKSTTLNALLRELDRSARNIMTLEDPVEYRFDGVSQTQVREQYGLGFAEGVRTMLRHDPDVILIGEIRDPATAQQAMRAAMTGHLVLSTLHTNNALGVIPRLVDLGVPRHLLPGHVRGAVAQRLVRTLCSHCKPQGGGVARDCPACFNTGRRGRTLVAEALEFPAGAEELFAVDLAPSRRDELLARQGFSGIWEHGAAKVEAGRVAYEDLAAAVSAPG